VTVILKSPSPAGPAAGWTRCASGWQIRLIVSGDLENTAYIPYVSGLAPGDGGSLRPRYEVLGANGVFYFTSAKNLSGCIV
jgi:hypothetical protein